MSYQQELSLLKAKEKYDLSDKVVEELKEHDIYGVYYAFSDLKNWAELYNEWAWRILDIREEWFNDEKKLKAVLTLDDRFYAASDGRIYEIDWRSSYEY